MSRIEMASRLRQLRRPKEALEQIQQEVAEDPHSVQAWIEFAWIRIARNELELGREAAERALELEPDHAYAHYVRAVVAGKGGKIKEALEFLREALGLYTYESAFHSYHAALCLCDGKADAGLAGSERALELCPEDPYALEVRVRILRACWREDEALEVARAALALHPEDPTLLVHFGELSLAKHDAVSAGSAFRSALRIDPTLARAKAGVIDALRAHSAAYRRLSGFLRRTDRLCARVRSSRGKKIALVVGGLCCLLGVLAADGASEFLLVPFVIAFDVAFLWCLLYYLARLAVSAFLVPVFFDALGKAALKDTWWAWWNQSGRGARHPVVLVMIGGLALMWPPLFVVLAIGLPFLAARRLSAGRMRRVGTALALLATVFVGMGLAPAWSADFEAVSGSWLLAAVGAGMSVAALLVHERRRAQRPS